MTNKKRIQLFFIAFLIGGIITVCVNAFGASATLSWQASPSSNVDGYKVYHGESSGNYYNSPFDVGKVLTFVVPNLQENKLYYFAVTAYNSAGESVFSNEVSGMKLGIPSSAQNLTITMQ